MIYIKKALLLFSLLFLFKGTAQISDVLLEKIQQYPKNYASIEDLSYRIKNDFKTDREKAAAAYTWITLNITYDIQRLYSLRSSTTIFYDSDENRKKRKEKRIEELTQTTFKTRKGLCEGYALLYNELCSNLGVTSTIVNGYTRNSTNDIDSYPKRKNHSWNSIYFDQEWHLVDVTWGAGKMLSKNLWSFDFNPEYFNPPPELFINRHFPADYKWQLLPNPIDKGNFFAQPLIYDLTKNPNIIISNNHIEKITLNPSQKHIFIHFDKVSKDTDLSYMFGYNQIQIKKMKIRRKENGSAIGIIKYRDKISNIVSLINENEIIAEFIVQQ